MRQHRRSEVYRWVLALAALALAPAAAEAEESQGAPAAAASVDELIAALGAPDTAARVAAIRALGDQRQTAAVPALTNLLGADPVPEVRGWAVRALDSIGTPEARAALARSAREDPDERVRSVAARLAGVAPAPAPTQPAAPFTPFQAPPVQPAAVQPYPPYSPYGDPVQVAPRPPRIPGRGLRIGGIVVTSVSYGLALIVGIALLSAGAEDEYGYGEPELTDFGWKMLLPIVGPGIAAQTNDFGEASIPFWIWSLAEVAGVTLLAIGYSQRARYLRETAEDAEPDAEPAQAEAAETEDAGGEGAEGAEDAGDEYGDEPVDDDGDDARARPTRRDVGVAVVPGPGGLALAGWF